MFINTIELKVNNLTIKHTPIQVKINIENIKTKWL